MQNLHRLARYLLIAAALAGVFLIAIALAKNPPCNSKYPECSCDPGAARLMAFICIGSLNSRTIGAGDR